MPERLSQLWIQLRGQMAADKKKAVILGVLFVVLLGAVGNLLLGKDSSVPEEAVAVVVPQQAQTASTGGPSVRPRPEPTANRSNVEGASMASGGTQFVRDRLASFFEQDGGSVSVDGLPRRLARDPFTAQDWSQFPLVISPQEILASKNSSRESGGFWSGFIVGLADRHHHRQEEIRRINADLESLVLQSTITGPVPLAHISGRLVRPGDHVDGFSVVRIDDRRVTLERSGIERVIKMP